MKCFTAIFCAHFFPFDSFLFNLTAHQIHIEGTHTHNEQFKFIDRPLKLCFIAQLDVHMVWFTRSIYVADTTNPRYSSTFPLQKMNIMLLPCEKFFLTKQKCYSYSLFNERKQKRKKNLKCVWNGRF